MEKPRFYSHLAMKASTEPWQVGLSPPNLSHGVVEGANYHSELLGRGVGYLKLWK